ncbi:hypothetical protein ABEB36_008779 [Hypothenemus hampei]|uniref:Uncharacterized protein n=1 Tax=Hypothenemus hampei TaxID=57062 RepID=A0ABD1EN53_HYPHA
MDLTKIYRIIMLLFSMGLLTLALPQYLENDQSGEASETRVKRDHHHHDHHHHHQGITGPVHTFVKTDKHAHFKWGVRHHVGHHYAKK